MKIVKLSTLSADEVLRLTTYLEKFSKGEDKQNFVISHLGNFFTNLSLEQNVELSDAVSESSKDAIEAFIKKYPDIDVNLDGDTKIVDIPGWKVKEEALTTAYDLAYGVKRKTTKIKQIIKAKELTCLRYEDAGKYEIERLSSHILDKYERSKIDDYVKRLQKIIPIKDFLAKVFSYYKHTGAEYFVKYVFFHLDVLMLDTKLESRTAKEYIKAINSIIL